MASVCVSNSVRIHVSAAAGIAPPTNISEAISAFSQFGDIARVDITLLVSTGCLLITFYDVRVAQQVIQLFGGMAEPSAPAPHDLRSVIMPMSSLAELPGFQTKGLQGLQNFGEVAHSAYTNGETDIEVEYYDMRAAQRALYTLKGSRPSYADVATVPPSPAYTTTTASTPLLGGKGGVSPLALSDEATQLRFHEAMLPGAEGAGTPLVAPQASNASSQSSVPDFTDGMGASFWYDNSGPAASSPMSSPSRRGSNSSCKELRFEKLNAEDVAKYEVMPHNIESGEDTRTTVMLRNIPKSCSHEGFVELLEACGLGDKYTFLYMPFDKRRNLHCGFAFVNFASPHDVLSLYSSMQAGLWRRLSANTPNGDKPQNSPSMPPAVSYARLQGKEQLMKHFSLSSVMHNSDPRKRPLFIERSMESIAAAQTSAPVKLELDSTVALQPRYVPQPSLGGTPAKIDTSLVDPTLETGSACKISAELLDSAFSAGSFGSFDAGHGLGGFGAIGSTLGCGNQYQSAFDVMPTTFGGLPCNSPPGLPNVAPPGLESGVDALVGGGRARRPST